MPRFWPLLIVAIGIFGLFRRPAFVTELDALIPGVAGGADRTRRRFSLVVVGIGLLLLVFTSHLVDERIAGPAVVIALGIALLGGATADGARLARALRRHRGGRSGGGGPDHRHGGSGRQELSTGAGGDRTVEIDRLAEETAIAAFEQAASRGLAFSVLSEEIGHRSFGADFPLVVLDPIDGSLNAKQGVPCYAVMLSLLEGPTVADVSAGYVMNLVNGEEFSAIRGGGAQHRDQPFVPLLRSDPGRFEVVALESSPGSLFAATPLLKRAQKLRVLGSMALSIAHTATGSFDVFCSSLEARVFDMTASLLVLTEAGGVATDMEGASLDGLEVGFSVRTTLLAAADPAAHALALEILRVAESRLARPRARRHSPGRPASRGYLTRWTCLKSSLAAWSSKESLPRSRGGDIPPRLPWASASGSRPTASPTATTSSGQCSSTGAPRTRPGRRRR